MASLAVVILTLNEKENIRECIETASFADEVLIIDSGSNDGTQDIACSLGARVVERPMDESGFAGQRNFALTQTKTEWVFYLDADERLTAEAAEEIKGIVRNGTPAAWEIRRINYVMGKEMRYGAHRPDWSLRLYPRDSVQWKGTVHEQALITVPARRMRACMHHYTYADWESYFQKFNRYTTIAAESLHARGKRATLFKTMLDPLFTVFKMYILKAGFLDGWLGWVMSVMAGYYTFVKYLKLRQL